MKLSTLAAASLLAVTCAAAHAQSWLDVHAPPLNHPILALSAGGQSALVGSPGTELEFAL